MTQISENPASNESGVDNLSQTAVVVEILDLALNFFKTQSTGKLQQGAVLAEVLLQIAQKAHQAYEDNTGHPLDPALIRPEVL